MDIKYRAFEKGDFMDLATIADDEWQSNHRSVAEAMMRTSGNIEHCVLAFDNDTPVGYVYGFALPNRTLIPEFLYVKVSHRKNGIAKVLIETLERTTGCTASMVFYNRALHNFYSHLGYYAGKQIEVAVKELQSQS